MVSCAPFSLGRSITPVKDTEDYIYGKYTPYGIFRAGIVTEVAEKMDVGKAYYVDITPAD